MELQYIHAYKLNSEYDFKKYKNYCILLEQLCVWVDSRLPTGGVACKTNDIYAIFIWFSNVQKFELPPVIKKINICRCV